MAHSRHPPNQKLPKQKLPGGLHTTHPPTHPPYGMRPARLYKPGHFDDIERSLPLRTTRRHRTVPGGVEWRTQLRHSIRENQRGKYSSAFNSRTQTHPKGGVYVPRSNSPNMAVTLSRCFLKDFQGGDVYPWKCFGRDMLGGWP